MNGHKITSLVIVGCCCRNFTSFGRSDVSDVDFGEILSWVVHFPLLSKVVDDQTKEAHLSTIENNSFGLFLGPDELIDADDSSKIPDIAKYNNIVFETILLGDFCIDFIDINFVIKFVAHFNQVICTGLFIYELSWVVYNALEMAYDMYCSSLKVLWVQDHAKLSDVGISLRGS